MTIGPHDVLPKGTAVQVNDERGIVVKAHKRKDQFGEPIMVHEIEFQEEQVLYIPGGWQWVPMKPYRETSNYSFVEVIDETVPKATLPY